MAECYPLTMTDRDHWIHLGRLYREAAKALWRMELRAFPIRRAYPPPVLSSQQHGGSWPEKEALRRLTIEERSILKRDELSAALRALGGINPEALLAIQLVDMQHLRLQAAADSMRTYTRRLQRLLDEGWAMIARCIEGGKGEDHEDDQGQQGATR